MIMTESNVIDMCDVYEPRVPRERPRDRGALNPSSASRGLFSAYLACTTNGRLTFVFDNMNPEPGLEPLRMSP